MKTRLLLLALITLCCSFFIVDSASAQSTEFTYQGRVLDNGTNFNGAGQFKFALVTSTNASSTATATASMGGSSPNEFVNGFTLTYSGGGYVIAPAVTISGGGGSGATATTTISGGAVTSVNIINPGSGYTSSPTVTIAAPPSNITYLTFWSNDGTSVAGSQPTAAVSVGVGNGLFTVVLGDTTLANMTAIDASLFAQPNLQLRIWFNDGANGFAALSPAQNLTPTPYAIMANSLPGLSIQQNSSGAPNVIGGASFNFVSPGTVGATVGGGGATSYSGTPYTNNVTGDFGTVAGGVQNSAGYVATVGGGYDNDSLGSFSTVSGGAQNTNNSDYATISGGILNLIQNAGYSFIGAGYQNFILSPAGANYFDVIAGGQNNLETNAVYSFIGGGYSNNDFTSYSVIGGGTANTLNIFARYSVIVGGQNNLVSSNSDHSVIGGGLNNLVQTSASVATVAGGASNVISANTLNGTIGGGSNNFVNGISGTVGGGEQNSATAFRDTVGGGLQNQASGGISTVAGGWTNIARGNSSSIGGGDHNLASSLYATIPGGGYNQATNNYATVPGGFNNVAGGQASFAAGFQAQALHQGAFVWADSQGTPFSSTANNQFLIRAQNGVGINRANPSQALDVQGNIRVSGLIRIGSETNAPGPAYTDAGGMLIRRVSSQSMLISNVVARTDLMTLERDGTAAGLVIRWNASPGYSVVNAMGITTSGTVVSFHTSISTIAAAGSTTIFSNAQNVSHYDISFGDPYDPVNLTHVALDRYDTDFFMTGTIISSYNQ